MPHGPRRLRREDAEGLEAQTQALEGALAELLNGLPTSVVMCALARVLGRGAALADRPDFAAMSALVEETAWAAFCSAGGHLRRTPPSPDRRRAR